MGSPAQASCPSSGLLPPAGEGPSDPSGTEPKYRPLTWYEPQLFIPIAFCSKAGKLAFTAPSEALHTKSLLLELPASVCVWSVHA